MITRAAQPGPTRPFPMLRLMGPRLLALGMAALPLPAWTQPMVYRDDTMADRFLDAPDMDTLEDMLAFLDTRDEPIVASYVPVEYKDPEHEHVYFAFVEPDSSAWIQTPSGQNVLVDPYAVRTIGDEMGARLGVGIEELGIEGVGYGLEDGRAYVDLTKSASIGWVLGLLAATVAAAGLVLAWLLHQLRRSREHGRQLADSRRRLADSREAERMRLARELHDGPMQDLQAMRLALSVAARDGAGPEVPELNVALLGVASELRRIAEDLRPPVLDTFGLAAALRALADRLRARHPGAALELELDDDGADLPDGVGIALYRIAQEAISNALRHGGAALLRARYHRGAAAADLRIEDDGRGFALPRDLTELEREGHLGLAGMKERAESLGGRLRIESEPGRTVVHASLPLSPPLPSPA